jgi:hypothetical protein
MNSTEELPEAAVHGLLAGAFDPTGADLPTVSLVPGVVSGFEKHRRRTRLLGGVASVAVLGVAAAAFAMVPGSGSPSGTTPGGRATTTGAPKAAAPAYDIFAHPGTPDAECRASHWMDTGVTPSQGRETCLLTLPLLRGLLPDATVVVTHIVRDDTDPALEKAGLTSVLKEAKVGVPHPAIATEWARVQGAPNDEYNLVDTGEYSVRNPDGSTFGVGFTYSPHGPNQDPNSTCVDGKAAGSQVPCWSVTLANGTKATFVNYPFSGGFEAYVMTANGGQFTFGVNSEVSRYIVGAGPGGKFHFDLATGTLNAGSAPESGRFTTEQFSALLRSQGFADLVQKYLDQVSAH